MASTPSPWWTSRSRYMTLIPRSRAQAIPTAASLKTPNPLAVAGMAWWLTPPDGTNAKSALPLATCWRAWITPPLTLRAIDPISGYGGLSPWEENPNRFASPDGTLPMAPGNDSRSTIAMYEMSWTRAISMSVAIDGATTVTSSAHPLRGSVMRDCASSARAGLSGWDSGMWEAIIAGPWTSRFMSCSRRSGIREIRSGRDQSAIAVAP